MRRFILFGLSMMFLSACQPPTETTTEEDLAAVAEEVRQQTINLSESWNTLDPDLHGRHYAEDMRWGGNGGFLVGEGFRSAIASYMATFSEYNQQWQEIEVQVLSPDAAVAGVIQTFNTVRNNGDVAEGVEAMTLVWKRMPEGWKVVHGHTSSR